MIGHGCSLQAQPSSKKLQFKGSLRFINQKVPAKIFAVAIKVLIVRAQSGYQVFKQNGSKQLSQEPRISLESKFTACMEMKNVP